MCSYSMVIGHYQDKWPNPINVPPIIWPDIQELAEKARKYDELMAQKDCPDPKKEEWMRQLKEFYEKIGSGQKE